MTSRNRLAIYPGSSSTKTKLCTYLVERDIFLRHSILMYSFPCLMRTEFSTPQTVNHGQRTKNTLNQPWATSVSISDTTVGVEQQRQPVGIKVNYFSTQLSYPY